MGALPRLKKKDELHYRKGSTNDTLNCQWCVNFINNYEARGIGGVLLRVEGRCKMMGVQSSIRYRVRPDYTCDIQLYDGR